MANNRTEKPSPKKRKDARKKGQVARSKELSSAAVYLVVLSFFGLGGAAYILRELQIFTGFLWRSFLTVEITPQSSRELLHYCGWSVMKLAAPLLLLTLVIGVGTFGAQGGWVFSTEKLKVSFSNINPARKLKSIFSSRGLVELGKALGLIAVITFLALDVLNDRMVELHTMAFMSVPTILSVFGDVLFTIALRVGIFMALVAVADYFFQRHRFEKDLKQTKQEVKDDFKEMEGNPVVKGRIRRLQMQMARRRMLSAVPTADVVITNPTEYAVALKYDIEKMAAPKVVAKGKERLAAKIKEIAREHRVPTVENVPLAQALYKSVEVDQEVPAKLYQAVAQILAYVYKLKETSWR
jgi:flagellar biosynthetic protein FlhB